jgi:hypothetical protein
MAGLGGQFALSDELSKTGSLERYPLQWRSVASARLAHCDLRLNEGLLSRANWSMFITLLLSFRGPGCSRAFGPLFISAERAAALSFRCLRRLHCRAG